MKKSLVILCGVLLVFGVMGNANATLEVIGTASYLGINYNLIYEDDQGLVWLDYTKGYAFWGNQVTWAAGLNGAGVLTYNLNPGISVSWVGDWRLPSTDPSVAYYAGYGYSGPDQTGKYSYAGGYNMTNSEMGYLYYESLMNKAFQATDGTYPQPGWGLTNTAPFNNLKTDRYYWSGTEFFLDGTPPYIGGWLFGFEGGVQGYGTKSYDCYALAVRSGDVSFAPVPEPIDIDIKPGSCPNSINLGSKGVVPVAVLTTEVFDASTVDPSTVKFAGASPVRWTMEDVNGDGDVDLLFHFKTQELNLTEDNTEATLTGFTYGGQPIEGTDSVRIVPTK